MLWYPVQRHRLPSSPTRTSSSLGCGFSASSDTAAMTMPGVQKPHCRPCSVWNACCMGCNVASPLLAPVVAAKPSMVVTSLPSAWTASIVHDLTDSPSSRTVHAPHDDVSHPTFVPVRPRSSRR